MAGAMMLLNTRTQMDSDIESFGWPFPVELHFEHREHAVNSSPLIGRIKWDDSRMLANVAAWAILISVGAIACEHWARRHTAQ